MPIVIYIEIMDHLQMDLKMKESIRWGIFCQEFQAEVFTIAKAAEFISLRQLYRKYIPLLVLHDFDPSM